MLKNLDQFSTRDSMDRYLEILKAWEIDTVKKVTTIHPGRVFKVELENGVFLLLKDIGKEDPQVFRRFEFEYDVLRHLHQVGISVAIPILDRRGKPLVIHNEHYFTLSPFLTTNNRWLDLNFDELKNLYYNCGSAIARLHIALASFPTVDIEKRTWKTVFPDVLLNQCIPNVCQNMSEQERTGFEMILHDLIEDINTFTKGLSEQLIHRDCHTGNIVVNGEQVSGFVDCDHISLGPKIFDIADFLVHMIKNDVSDRELTKRWLNLFPVVLEGYEKENPLSEKEKQGLYFIMLGTFIMFADWFYKIGDADKAQAEMVAFNWMYRNRQEICKRIMAV
jgi:Ser/Thr protein kinase RdoA (MazF antagonist)